MRPLPITVLSVVSVVAAGYLVFVAGTMFLNWDMFSFRAGAGLLGGFETAGPLAFLVGAAAHGLIGYGLWSLRNWARHAAIGLAVLHAILALPVVSENAIGGNYSRLVVTGIPMMVAAGVIFYLMKPGTVGVFEGG
jgi:hypothetical protein